MIAIKRWIGCAFCAGQSEIVKNESPRIACSRRVKEAGPAVETGRLLETHPAGDHLDGCPAATKPGDASGLQGE